MPPSAAKIKITNNILPNIGWAVAENDVAGTAVGSSPTDGRGATAAGFGISALFRFKSPDDKASGIFGGATSALSSTPANISTGSVGKFAGGPPALFGWSSNI